ncbi:FtsX-like permease family protein [Anaerosporobacter sp.]
MFYIRYLFQKFKCNKFKTLLNIFSVAMGLAIILAIQLSTTNNINEQRENAKYLNGGDISITPYSASLNTEQSDVLNKLQELETVQYSTGTWLKTTCQVKNKSTNFILRFVDFNQYPNYVKQKYSNMCNNDNEIILSKNLAHQLNVSENDKIEIFNPSLGTKDEYTVKNIVELDNETDMDMNLFGYAFINSNQIENYFAQGSIPIHKVYIKTDENKVNQIEKELQKVFSKDELKTSYQLFRENEKEVKQLMKSISIIGIIATIMGGIGIASTIVLNIKNEQKEICLLRTLGMKQKNLNFMIILESCITGFSSYVLSIPLGLFFAYKINNLLYEGMKFRFYSEYFQDIFTILFISLGISIIFSFIPAKLCNGLNPVMILRESELSKENKIKLFKPILFIGFIVSIGATIYFNNLSTLLYIALFLILAGTVFLLLKITFSILNWICNIPILSCSIVSMSIKRLKKNTKNLCLIISTLFVGLASIGLTQNISGSILPGVEALINNQLGYNVLLTSSKNNENKITNELNNMDSIIEYSQTLRMNTILLSANNQDILKQVENNATNETNLIEDKKMIRNLTIEGINEADCENIKMLKGRAFEKADNKKNVVIINENLANAVGLECNDVIQLNINNNVIEYEIIGVYEKQLVNTSEIKVPLQALASDVGWTSVTYYLNIDEYDLDNAIENLYSTIDDCFIVNMRDMTPSLYNTIRKQMNLFQCISIIAVASYLLFMTNIILIDMLGRRKELMLYKIMGANYKKIASMIAIEAIIIGAFAGILAFGMCNIFTGMFLRIFLNVEYVKESISMWTLLAAGVGLSLISMLLVLPQVSISKLNSILREY